MNEAFKDISVRPVRSEAASARLKQLSLALYYGLAILYSVGGVAVLEIIRIYFPEDEPPIILLALCVTATAWQGGLGPGVLATILVALGSWGFLIPPEGFALPHATQVMRLVLIVASGAAVSFLAEGLRQTLALLQSSERRVRIVLDTAALGIVECDKDDQVILANRNALKLLSYPLDKLLGKSIRDLTAPEDRPFSDGLYKKLHDGTLAQGDYETRFLRFDGSPVLVHATVAPVRDADGLFLGSIGTVEDITDRKRNEAGRERTGAAKARPGSA